MRQTFYPGNFAPYLVSYMRNRTDEVGLRNVDGLWITMFGGLGNSFGMTIGGLLDKRFGPRVATAVGSVLFRYVLKVSPNCNSYVIISVMTVDGPKIGRAYSIARERFSDVLTMLFLIHILLAPSKSNL